MAFEFTDTNFQAEALNPNGAAVVDFGLNGVALVNWLDQLLTNFHQNLARK